MNLRALAGLTRVDYTKKRALHSELKRRISVDGLSQEGRNYRNVVLELFDELMNRQELKTLFDDSGRARGLWRLFHDLSTLLYTARMRTKSINKELSAHIDSLEKATNRMQKILYDPVVMLFFFRERDEVLSSLDKLTERIEIERSEFRNPNNTDPIYGRNLKFSSKRSELSCFIRLLHGQCESHLEKHGVKVRNLVLGSDAIRKYFKIGEEGISEKYIESLIRTSKIKNKVGRKKS